VNQEEFIHRLRELLRYYELSASSFADRIGVQRSSISHLLTGRNKPSLEFVLKILDTFSEVDFYWLMKGEGTFPRNSREPHSPALESLMATPKKSASKKEVRSPSVEKIILLHSDGSFTIYSEG